MGLESPNSIVAERVDNPLAPSAWISPGFLPVLHPVFCLPLEK